MRKKPYLKIVNEKCMNLIYDESFINNLLKWWEWEKNRKKK